MRTGPLTAVSISVAAIAAALVLHLPDDFAVALVVAPLGLSIICGLLLLCRRPVRFMAFITLPVSFAVAIAGAAVLDHYDVGIYFNGPQA